LKGRDDDENLKLWEKSWITPQPNEQPVILAKEKEAEPKLLTAATGPSTADSFVEPVKEDFMIGEILSSSRNILETAPLGAELKLVPDDLSNELKIDGDLISFLTSADPSPIPEEDTIEDSAEPLESTNDIICAIKEEVAAQEIVEQTSEKKPVFEGSSEPTPAIEEVSEAGGKLMDKILPLDTPKEEHLADDLEVTTNGSFDSINNSLVPENNINPTTSTVPSKNDLLKTCRMHLLEHILDIQQKLVERLGHIEKRVKEQEVEMGFEKSIPDDDSDLTAFKSSVKSLYKDLDTIIDLANL
jgi:hypothetical protein